MKKVLWWAMGAVGLLGVFAWSRRATTYPRLNPDLQEPKRYFRSFGLRTPLLLPLLRKTVPELPHIEGLSIERHEVLSADGTPFNVYVYLPVERAPERPAVLYTHGGGYILGSATTTHRACAFYARELGAVVVSPEYRLAPEAPFPKPLQDVYAALEWLHSHAAELDIDPQRVALAGGSAGGGLSACAAQMAHDRGLPVRFQMLLFPMLDDRTNLKRDHHGRGEYIWTPSLNQLGWDSYLGAEKTNPPAYSVAARRENLSGLPPAWIGTGDLDLFYDEDAEYAARLRDAGTSCEFVTYAGVYHGPTFMKPQAAVTRQMNADSLAALRRGLGMTGSSHSL